MDDLCEEESDARDLIVFEESSGRTSNSLLYMTSISVIKKLEEFHKSESIGRSELEKLESTEFKGIDWEFVPIRKVWKAQKAQLELERLPNLECDYRITLVALALSELEKLQRESEELGVEVQRFLCSREEAILDESRARHALTEHALMDLGSLVSLAGIEIEHKHGSTRIDELQDMGFKQILHSEIAEREAAILRFKSTYLPKYMVYPITPGKIKKISKSARSWKPCVLPSPRVFTMPPFQVFDKVDYNNDPRFRSVTSPFRSAQGGRPKGSRQNAFLRLSTLTPRPKEVLKLSYDPPVSRKLTKAEMDNSVTKYVRPK